MSKSTSTSSFGVSSRQSHDSSAYYARKMSAKIDTQNNSRDTEIPEELVNTLHVASSDTMSDVPDNSVHLVVTSPPYNVGKEYDSDLPMDAYLNMLESVFAECHRVMAYGGRICVNVANLGRSPYIPLNAQISHIMAHVGFIMRGEIIWDKAAGSGGSTAWGSWMSPSNPTLRDTHEYILVFSKGSMGRRSDRQPTITREEFLEYTKSVWHMQPERATRIGHPAPFPVELPYRLIQLYTFRGDTVLDPFIGSGTTAVAALRLGRTYIGYDTEQKYIDLAKSRISKEKQVISSQKEATDSRNE